MSRRPPPAAIGALVAVEVVSAVLAWRDLARRTDTQVRGPKRLWRVLICANPGNSVGYWVFGRQPGTAGSGGSRPAAA